MRVEHMKELSTIVELLKTGNSVDTKSVSVNLQSGLVCLKHLLVGGIAKILHKLSIHPGNLLAGVLLDRYDELDDQDIPVLEKEILGLENALQCLYTLVDKGCVDMNDEYVKDHVNVVVLDLWRSAWVATCLFLDQQPSITREEIKELLERSAESLNS